MMKRILAGVAALIVVLLIGAGIFLWDPLPANPSATELSAAAANYDAEVIRDEFGVPHVHGARDADAAFGLAYAHAEDDYETIQETVAAGRGMLAHYRGQDAAPVDYLVALLGVWDTVALRYETDVPEDVKAMAEAYAAGLNLYAAENPKATWRGLAPFTAEDVVAGFIFKTPFFYGLDDTFMGLFGNDYTQTIALDPAEGRKAFLIGPKTMAERGSNGIAVSGRRAGDDVTRLMINSHQPLTGPVAWYEAQLTSDEGLDITGGLFPGTPVILHGFTPDLGWANTVSAQDLVDTYVLTVNPDNPHQYKLDGEWVDFTEATVTLHVKLFGPFALTVKRPVKRSAQGPVIEAKHGTYAVRYAGMGEIRQLEQYYRLNKAEDMDGFMSAMSLNALPSINYIYADKDANVAFIHNGQYPNRDNAWDWSGDMPGDRSDLIWQGYRPWDAVPKLVNPVSGLVFNSNNTPYSATDGPDNLKPDDFPQSMGLQTNQTNRSLRMIELTDGKSPINEPDLLAIKFDTTYSSQSEAADLIAKVVAIDWSQEPEMAEAAKRLAAWDLNMNADSRYAALGGLTVLREITAKYTRIPAPKPETAFREAVEWLTVHHGRIDPEWGEVNRLVRGNVSLPISGGPDTLRAVYPAGMRDDGTLHMTAGDTWIALVEWDRQGRQTARVISPYGSAILDAASPHYADQAPLFVAREWRKAHLTHEDVVANATRTYHPGKD
ncbi:MAG: penicillin acylase family protein [Hyphomonas oceanitis]|uniref:penicillin acylase family protein n=1 Tax=Hyphomonas oceanitis TaxID=81033 RepID=UPI0030015227